MKPPERELGHPIGRAELAPQVVAWQRSHGRHDLPWQHTRDPYRVWLSEVMLQQTQVATVLGYYARFLQRFPDVRGLAAAPLDDVLALWSGLGYYGRARNLHRCAQAIVRDHGGVFPCRSEALARLPGIGPSTAAAIAVFCAGERVAILDGNVKRVLARALGYREDLALPRHERVLWGHAQALLPERDVEAYTQGLMDLGSSICTARSPACGACPLAGGCVARAEGRPLAYPVRSRRSARQRMRSVLLWLTHRERVWLVQRPSPGVWGGLWSMPEFADEDELAAFTAGWPGTTYAPPPVLHVLTHRDWVLQPRAWIWPDEVPKGTLRRLAGTLPAGQWHAIDGALALGLPAPVRRWLSAPRPGTG